MNTFKKLCGNCKHQGCCTRSVSPMLFSQDLEDLKAIGKATDEFIGELEIKGKKFKTLKKKPNSNTCIFWDEEKKNCSIYNKRPFECRAYPFSLELVNGKCYWMIYSCNPEANWKWSEDYLEILEKDKQYEEIMQNIEYFVRHLETTLHEWIGEQYTIIREVNRKEKIAPPVI